MRPAPFDYVAPQTIAGALAALTDHAAEARALAGGQSLVPMLALRLARPELLVDLNRIPELVGICENGREIRIGAMTRQAALLASPTIARRVPLLAKALAEVGHPATRARGTIGGSLAHADPAAELPAVMLAEEASFVIRGSAGERVVPAADFFRGMFETAVASGELLTEIRIPAAVAGGTGFVEIARRKGDFAILMGAAKLALDPQGRCVLARVVLGAVAAVPVRCLEVEAHLLGRTPDEGAIAEAVARLPRDAIGPDGGTASRGYRLAVAPVVLRRAVAAAALSARDRS
jgi:carbon-monoxide dehydrogenase medium subunit